MMSSHGLAPGKLVHIGAHEGQEMKYYRQAGFNDVDITLIEPMPDYAALLRRRFPQTTVVQCAIDDRDTGVANFNVGKITNVSSLGCGPNDQIARTIEVQVRRLRDVVPNPEYMVIDAQGFELNVMKSSNWGTVKAFIVEACTIPDPTMASDYSSVSALAQSLGFHEIAKWSRSYDFIARWCRGTRANTGAEVLDVVYAR